MSLTSFMVRTIFKRGDDKRDAGCTTPEDVRRFDDIVYGLNPRWNRLDVYRPKDAEGLLPVIVSVHGGGWVYGDKERYQYYCMSLAQQGFAVVNFTYRLAPEYKFPAPVEDTNQVFTWLLTHADTYGFDIGNIFALSAPDDGTEVLAGYRPTGEACAPAASEDAEQTADGICQKASAEGSGQLRLAARHGLSLYALHSGRADGDGCGVRLPPAGKRGTARLAVYAQAGRDDNLGELGGSQHDQARLAQPLLEGRGVPLGV